jgi:hypothetical protein
MIVKAIVWSETIRTFGVFAYLAANLVSLHGLVIEDLVSRVEKIEVFRWNMRN